MGLAISHDCWGGSYGTFGAWTGRVAQTLGYETVELYSGTRRVSMAALVPTLPLMQGYDLALGNWPSGQPKDPALYLIYHYDNHGYIPAPRAIKVARRLEVALEHMSPDEWAARDTIRFIRGLERAAVLQEDVEFH